MVVLFLIPSLWVQMNHPESIGVRELFKLPANCSIRWARWARARDIVPVI